MVTAEAAMEIVHKMVNLMNPEEAEDFTDILVEHVYKHPLDMQSVIIRSYRQWSGVHEHKMGMSIEFLRAMQVARDYDIELYQKYTEQLPGNDVLDHTISLMFDDLRKFFSIEQINHFRNKIKIENRYEAPTTYYGLCRIDLAAMSLDGMHAWTKYIGSDTSTYFHEKLNQALYELAQSL